MTDVIIVTEADAAILRMIKLSEPLRRELDRAVIVSSETRTAPVVTWTTSVISASAVAITHHRRGIFGRRQAARAMSPARPLATMTAQAQCLWKSSSASISRPFRSGSRRACRGDAPRPPGLLLLDDVKGP